jgi:predicted RNA-binding Zn-ribbon protein involved in translation (DUF1610 family)
VIETPFQAELKSIPLRCVACQYDLTGIASGDLVVPCPECGHSHDPRLLREHLARAREREQRSWKFGLAPLLVCAAAAGMTIPIEIIGSLAMFCLFLCAVVVTPIAAIYTFQYRSQTPYATRGEAIATALIHIGGAWLGALCVLGATGMVGMIVSTWL